MKLTIEEEEIGNEGAVAIAQMLTVNTALKHLDISFEDRDGATKAFAERLPRMRGLEILDVGSCIESMTSETRSAFCQSS